MSSIKWFAPMLWLVLCPAAHAANSAVDVCSNLPTVAQSGCFEKLVKAADAKLNAVYKGAIRVIAQSNDDSAAWKTELKRAEQAWIAFRDADCGALTAFEWGHGTGMGAATELCILQKTEQRTRDLAERYSNR